MRALLPVTMVTLSACTTVSPLSQPQVDVAPYLAIYQLRGDVKMQSDPGGGAPPQNNAPQPTEAFGQGRHDSDLGGRLDIGDGFAGLRFEYYRMSMETSRYGTLGDDFGALTGGDQAQATFKMDEYRLSYVHPIVRERSELRDKRLDIYGGLGGVLAHRSLRMRSRNLDGSRQQSLDASGEGMIYPAARFRVAWQSFAVDLEYAICPDLMLGGEFNGLQQDFEARIRYDIPYQDITLFAGYRYSTLNANGTQGNLGWDADLALDGFLLGVRVGF